MICNDNLDKIVEKLKNTNKINLNGSRAPTSLKTLEILEKLADNYGKTVNFSDPDGKAGSRTVAEQEDIRPGSGYGTKGQRISQHVLGTAADIYVTGVNLVDLADMAKSFGATGTIVYPKNGFVHIDTRTDGDYHPR